MTSNLLTSSRFRTFRKCARLERIEYVDGWRPVEDSDALAFGALWHRGLEAWFLQHQFGVPDAALDAAFAAAQQSPVDDPYAMVRCEELLRIYDQQWRDQAGTVVAVEAEFRAPLLNPATLQPSRTWRLAGKVDAMLEIDGRNLVVEHKTTSEDIAPAADYWLRLAMDHQLSIYFIGAEALGFPPSGCLYDVVKKPAQRPFKATPVEARKFTKDGALYANQREVDETADEYRVRVRAALEADPAAYVQRRFVPRIESQILEFLQDAWQQARAMRDAHRAGTSPRNPDACFAYGRCAFWDSCSAGLDLAAYPTRFRRLDWAHPELTEDPVDSTETSLREEGSIDG